ncbi:MAG: purine-nucleoside/S-methyl-5-thioadenosine phosphorylase / adenosine deaminase [Rhodospirillaceae bacterium]|jgi:YfiH family protein|nr:purine-nucleoside/S-methyl-5-thioadenosine phosphorylase / adenosine deaminase [Rhodospirillaceae bacterium]
MIIAHALAQSPRIRHGFFGRTGGVSEGIYASLNCGFGSGDDPDRVAENRARAARHAAVDPASLVTVYQTHSPQVCLVERPWQRDAAPKVDAMVTTRPGIALGILTADCAPVLFADAEAGVVGAAHAGWRGAFDGVIEATVTEMGRQGADPARIAASIGPCIAQTSYEVGPEFRARFVAADDANARFFVASAQRPAHFQFDLPGYVAQRLLRAGVARIERIGRDTCAEADAFFSYRRNTLEARKAYGRNLSLISLEA